MPLPESEAVNFNFVQLVRTHRCLYDTASPQYNSKEEQNKAWENVAQTFDSTVAECKLRWKHLRGGVTRYIKRRQGKSGRAAKSIKKFYLWDAMQFVRPYLKSRSPKGNLPPFRPGNENGDPDDLEDGPDYFAADSVPETTRDGPESDAMTPTLYNSAKRGTKRPNSSASDCFERIVADCIATRSVEKPENPDLDFFKSILPDMAALNASQKRRFKHKVLQLLEDIFNEEAVS